jgi:ATP synthase F1 delta subunit
VKLRPDEIASILKSEIERYEVDVDIEEVGTVIQIGDGIARIYGLTACVALEKLELPHGVTGLALNLEEDNVAAVLVDNGRLELLHDVSVAYAELAAEQERILDIEVTTAVELGPAQVQQLQQSIEQATGLSARLEAKIDPAIIGGIVLRARGVLLDASVQRELDEIHRALITTPLPVGSEA